MCGQLLAVGTPEQIIKDNKSITGHYLKDKL
jgi:excinuclease ABC subunit A